MERTGDCGTRTRGRHTVGGNNACGNRLGAAHCRGMAVSSWRPSKVIHCGGCCALRPTVAIAIDVFWGPADTLGVYVWALHAMAIGALMVVMAERFSRVDGPGDRLRVSFGCCQR